MTVATPTSKSTPGRYATISRDINGDIIGVAIFLTGDELASLGIDIETTDVIHVAVTDGSLNINATSEMKR